MAIDLLTLASARKFTKDTANALGAVKGAPCTIDSIVDTGDANIVTFGWTGADGSYQTTTMTTRHGIGIADMQIDDAGMLKCILSDGTVIEVGEIVSGNNCCDSGSCSCIAGNIASDDDVDPLLTAIGLYDMTTTLLLDELNNLLINESNDVLTT